MEWFYSILAISFLLNIFVSSFPKIKIIAFKIEHLPYLISFELKSNMRGVCYLGSFPKHLFPTILSDYSLNIFVSSFPKHLFPTILSDYSLNIFVSSFPKHLFPTILSDYSLNIFVSWFPKHFCLIIP